MNESARAGATGGWWGVLAVVLLLLAAPAPGLAQSVRRYSGTVERVELLEGLVVVEELGARGRPVRHEVRVGPETPVVSTRRLRPVEMRGPNAYGERPVSAVDLLAGDFVVVEAVEEEGRAVALRITIVETPRRPAPSP